MKTPAHISGSLAAMVLVLAACGGGGGDNGAKAVSSSPGTPATADVGTTGTAATTPGSTTGSGTDTSTSGSTTTASNNDTSSSAVSDNRARGTPNTSVPPVDTTTTSPTAPQPVDPAPAPTAPTADSGTTGTATPTTESVSPISAQGVRGDVLLTMLDQKSCRPFAVLSASHDGPELDNGEDFPPPWISHSLSADNYQTNPEYQSTVEHTPVPGALCPPVIIYSPASSGVYNYNLNSSIYGRFTSPGSRPRGFSMLDTSIPIAVSQDAVIIGNRIKATADAFWGKTYRDENPDGQPTDSEHSFGKSQSSKTIGLNSFVPIGVLSTWTDESYGEPSYTMTTRMMLLPGSNARQAKLCVDTNMKYVKRLHCTIWTVPENWKRGMELKDDGQYIVDDRSTYPGESGLLYWRTSGRD